MDGEVVMGNFVTGTRTTTAPGSTIWRLLADVERWPATFTPHLTAARLDGPLEPGSTGWVKTKLPLPRAGFTVTALDPGVSWEWQGKLLWLTMTFDHRIDEAARPTTITFEVDLDGPLAAVVRPLARLIYRPQMERALARLVQLAEATS